VNAPTNTTKVARFRTMAGAITSMRRELQLAVPLRNPHPKV
jgi:hypothetical protein